MLESSLVLSGYPPGYKKRRAHRDSAVDNADPVDNAETMERLLELMPNSARRLFSLVGVEHEAGYAMLVKLFDANRAGMYTVDKSGHMQGWEATGDIKEGR